MHFDLGDLGEGNTVHVELPEPGANVQLMDQENFRRYCSGGRFEYHGGKAEGAEITLHVPRYGHWHVAIDKTVDAKIEISQPGQTA